MIPIDTIPYTGLLPDSFFSIPAKIYKDLPFKPAEESAVVTKLFAMEAERNEIVIYTNHTNVRLAGIFPVNEPCFSNVALAGSKVVGVVVVVLSVFLQLEKVKKTDTSNKVDIDFIFKLFKKLKITGYA